MHTQQPTPQQAAETYSQTVKNVPREQWAGWVTRMEQALTTRNTSYLDNGNAWELEAYNLLQTRMTISLSDSN